MKLIYTIPLHKVASEALTVNHPGFLLVVSQGYLKVYKIVK